VIMWLCNYC